MSYFDDNEDAIIYGAARRHPKQRDRQQLSAPAGSELAQLRSAAHAAFDPFWKSGLFSRTKAYLWLATEMGLPVEVTHMVLFDEELCKRAIEICQAHPQFATMKYKAVADDFEALE